MEQPPGSLDDPKPQDVSTSSMPVVIDLTRKEEECILTSMPHDALQMVKSTGWYPHSGTTGAGLHFSETGSLDATLHSGNQIQPDNALSHATVTLSYVSRSHVFSTHDSLSQRLPLYSVSPISKFSLHTHCNTNNKLGETSFALNQHYLEQAEEPMNLATNTELFPPFSQAQVGPGKDAGGCLVQESHELNGGAISSEKFENPLQDEEEHTLPPESRNGLQNGLHDSWSSSGAHSESSLETQLPVSGEDEEKGSPDVLFIVSKTQDSVVVSDSPDARGLCLLSREYRSPLEDPVSPSATSLDDVEDVFLLPQASSSPSADNSYPETDEKGVFSALCTNSPTQPTSGGSTSVDSSDESKQLNHQRKVLEPLIDLTDSACVSDILERKLTGVVPHINGTPKALERTLKEKKLPSRSGRGTRLEAIVMNINSSRYKVSGKMLANKRTSASKSTAHDSTLSSAKRSGPLSVRKRRGKVKSHFSMKTTKQKVLTVNKDTSSNISADNCKDSTSVSELNKTKKLHIDTLSKSAQFARSKKEVVPPPQTSTVKSKRKPSLQSSPLGAVHKKSKKEPEVEPQVDNNVLKVPPQLPQPKSPRSSQCKTKSKLPGCKASPTAKVKATRAPKRRRKKLKRIQSSSMFSPKEPEIKLRYLTYKEEKRDVRLNSFSPFVHVERQQSSPSLCTVINYPEDVKVQHKKDQQQQAHTSSYIPAVVPSTSCLQLGRLSTHSQHQRALVCCLCGQSANAMDLGDLHGPYYPEGYQASTKAPASASCLKVDEDDYSDSDSSSCSVRVRPRALIQGARLKQKGLMRSRRWAGDKTSSPAKLVQSEAAPADVEDWYSPPVLPLEPFEYWLHEDCGVWSSGVFLVKGKVYGLEEAVRMAQDTVCSACHRSGASLGCFFKGCANKYHYRCALESDCVLVEENFSMKCKKHRNKTFKTPPGSRWNNR